MHRRNFNKLLAIGPLSLGVINPISAGTENPKKPKRALIKPAALKPGDRVLATVVQPENSQGYVVLSFKRCEGERQWKVAEDAMVSGIPLKVVVQEYNKGGLLVDCMGLRGFIPLSHLDRVPFANDVANFRAGSEADLK